MTQSPAAEAALPGQFTVLFFSVAASFVGKTAAFLPAPMPTSELFVHLDTLYPGFKSHVLLSCLVTVNLEYVDPTGDNIIKEGDEVGIIPPVSSG